MEPGPFEGLFIVHLDVLDDAEREGASFREAFQAQKMQGLGLPVFEPVQLNVAESRRGTLRGIHAEPWEKFIHVAYGEVFAAVADLRRESPTAGQAWTGVLDRTRAIFVGRGLGNAYQATSDLAVYTYLVNEHWQPGISYQAVRYDDADLGIEWPVTDEHQKVSSKDRSNPSLQELWREH